MLLAETAADNGNIVMELIVAILGSGVLTILYRYLKARTDLEKKAADSWWLDEIDTYASLAIHSAESWADKMEEQNHGKRPSKQEMLDVALESMRERMEASEAPEKFRLAKFLLEALEAKYSGNGIGDFDPDRATKEQAGKLLG